MRLRPIPQSGCQSDGGELTAKHDTVCRKEIVTSEVFENNIARIKVKRLVHPISLYIS